MSYPKDISDWQSEAWQTAESKGWHDDRSFGDVIALIHSEASEALEAYRDNEYTCDLYYPPGDPAHPRKPEGVMVELADIIIRVFDTAEELQRKGMTNATLRQALFAKMNYNRTRPHRHGGKRL